MFKVGDRVHLIGDPHWGTIKALIYGKERAEVYWEGLGILCQHDFYKLRKAEETTTMDNPFIKTVTTTSLTSAINLTPKVLLWADTSLSFSSDGKHVNLVIGASFEDRGACSFNKESLANLLKMLQEVHDLMKE